MQVTILGSGTSAPHPERAAPANWLQSDHGSMMLDFGASTVYRVAHLGLDWVNLDAIWISHFHLDHVGGLAPFLFGTRHAPQIHSRRKPLSVFGPHGFKDLLLKLDDTANGKLLKQPFPLVVTEVIEGEAFEPVEGLLATTFSTPHTPESLAIRIEDRNRRSVTYTSDTGYSEALSHFAFESDLLVMECSFFENKRAETHLELKEAVEMARLANPGKTVLTHLYPEWDGIDLEAEAARLWERTVLEAVDGLRIDV
jgi:ribonuclease BN (tRNA processing enzyme)